MHIAPRLRHRFQADPLFRRRLVFSLMGVFAALGWGSFLLASSALTIQSVEVQGGGSITSVEAKAAVFQILDSREGWRPWSPRHRWFLDANHLANALKTRWFAENVEVERPIGKNIVRLIVTEQHMNLYAKTGQQYLEIDANGVIRHELDNDERIKAVQQMTGRTNSSANSMIILEFPYIQDPLAVGYKLSAPTSIIQKSVLLATLLEKTPLVIRSMTHAVEASPTLIITDARGIQVYIDTSVSLEDQVRAWSEYEAARARKAKGVDVPHEFIDLRIPGRLYIK